MDAVVAALTDRLGPETVLTGAAVSERSAGIWRSDTVQAKALIRPASTEAVSQCLRICHEHHQAVVTHGGLTGLVEGAVASPDEVVVSLERLNRVEQIDADGRTATVEAGVVLQVLQEAAAERGLLFPLDLGGRGSCTLGGNLATNAGGNRVLRFGMARDMVLGLEAVLADGTVLSAMNQMLKNNAGYDLKQLFIGTEGTLGVITRAVLRLRELPGEQSTALVAVDAFEALPQVLKQLDAASAGGLSAFELMWPGFYELVTTPPARADAPLRHGYPYYVLLECLGPRDGFEAALMALLDKGLLADAVVARSESQRQGLWALRDDVAQCFRVGPCFIFDVSLPVRAMENYVATVEKRLRARFPAAHLFTFGHMGDGNLHFVASVGSESADARYAVESAIYEPLAEVGGSVSAEHGIGLEKKRWLSISRSPEEIQLMRTLKRALDPRSILNPGRVFDMTPCRSVPDPAHG